MKRPKKFQVARLKNNFYRSPIILIILLCKFPLLAQQSQSSGNKLAYHYLEEIFSKVSDSQDATRAFYTVLEKLTSPSKNNDEKLTHLYADVIDIMSEVESKQWMGLKTTQDKVAFFKRFWLIRDLTPATEANERLVEHYVRLAYAREKYKFFDARGYDDRGQIYVQYGAPDDYLSDPIHPSSVPIETWVYHQTKSPVTFDFIDRGYGYRLARRPDEGIKVETPQARFDAIGDLLLRRAFLSPEYNSAFTDYLSIQSEQGQNIREKLRRLELAVSQYASETAAVQAKMPKITSNVLKDISDLAFFAHLARFKEGAQSHCLVVAYGLKGSDLKFAKGDSILELGLAVAVKDTNFLTLTSRQDTLHVSLASFGQAVEFLGVWQYTISAGHYFVALDFNNAANRQRGLKEFSITAGTYPTDNLHLSSVVFAKEVRPASEILLSAHEPSGTYFTRHGLSIKPYPFSTLKPSAPIFVYFEIYDLKQNDAGENFYVVEYEVHQPAKKGFASLLASLNPFGKSGGSISVSETRRGNAAVEPTYLQLDFSQLRPGKYELIVRVTDKLAGITKESKLEFELE